jgi:hypothetical protein
MPVLINVWMLFQGSLDSLPRVAASDFFFGNPLFGAGIVKVSAGKSGPEVVLYSSQ